jgi:hypothetical protein
VAESLTHLPAGPARARLRQVREHLGNTWLAWHGGFGPDDARALARKPNADIFEILSELAPQHPRNDTFPGEVFLHLAADALEWCGPTESSRCP